MIRAENLVKKYGEGEGETYALNGVSLEIKKGEFAVILGASGSGKSTLLNVLSGLERADEGTIVCGKEELHVMTEKQLTDFRKRTVGFIFQQYLLLPHLTAEGNVKLGAHLSGNRDYAQLIEAVGLADKKKRYPAELSGGEQQRVCIARALAKNPRVLFLDEPTGALDEQTGRSVLDHLLKLRREKGVTSVMVTHNANIAQTADKVILMNSGKITQIVYNDSPKGAFEIGW